MNWPSKKVSLQNRRPLHLRGASKPGQLFGKLDHFPGRRTFSMPSSILYSWLQNFGTLVDHCKKVLVGDLKPSRGQLGGDSSLSIRSTVNGRLGCSSLSGFLGAKFNLTNTGVHWLLAPLESCWYVATIQPNNSFDYRYQLCADIMAATDILLYKHKVI